MPLARQRRTQQIMVADRRAAERHQNVGARLAGEADAAFEFREIIAEDAKIDHFSAGVFGDGGDREIIAGDDLRGAGLGARRHKFVARSDDRHARAPRDRNCSVIHRRGEREFGGAEAHAGEERDRAFAKVEASAANMRAGRRACRQRAVGDDSVFLKQYRVGALRHWRAGEDAHGFSRLERRAIAVACGAFADDAQRPGGKVSGAQRKAVHGRDGDGRLAAAGDKVGGQRAAARPRQRRQFFAKP